MNNNPEQFKSTQETSHEVPKSVQEKPEIIKNNNYSAEEITNSVEKQTEKAKKEAIETAISVETISKKVEHSSNSRRGPINKKQRDESYKKIMNQVQSELSPISRSFSKIIHNKTIEKASEVIGATIARPTAILAGAFMAFVATLLTYTISKTIGYALSGFETIGAFIIGWIIGVLYDYFKIIVTGKK